MAQIIFLHGASSSGKTTLAKALQQRADFPFWHVSIDNLRDSGVLPMERFRVGEFDWVASRDEIFDGFHQSIKAYADAGNNLVLEHILDTNGWLETLKRLLSGHDVLFVGLHCQIPELNNRELRRGDRRSGSAEQDQLQIHNGLIYDLEIQSEDGVDANAAAILEALRNQRRVSGFQKA